MPVRVPADVLAALENVDDGDTADGDDGAEGPAGLEEMEDDFVLRAMTAAGDSSAEEAEEDEKAADDEDAFDEADIARKIAEFERAAHGGLRMTEEEAAADDFDSAGEESEEEGEEDGEEKEGSEAEDEELSLDALGPQPSPPPRHGLDAEFERLLAEEYADDDIGGLDDADEAALSGPLSLSSFSAQMERFLERSQRPVAEGGATLSIDPADRAKFKQRLLQRLRAMAREEEADPVADGDWLPEIYRHVVRDDWDAQSILSTLSNVENHPRAITERPTGAAASPRQQKDLSASLVALIGRSAAELNLRGQRDAGVGVEEEDEGEEEHGDENDNGAGTNKGYARPKGESAAEKRARKAASKAERRDSRQRKKHLKALFATVERSQQTQQVQLLSNNPAGRRL